MRKVIMLVMCLSLLIVGNVFAASFLMPDQADSEDVKFHVKEGGIYIENHAPYPVMFFSCINVSACSFKKWGKQFPDRCEMWSIEDGAPIDGNFYRNIAHWDCYILAPGEKTTLYVHSCYTNMRFRPQGAVFHTFSNQSEWEKFTKTMRMYNHSWRMPAKMYFK